MSPIMLEFEAEIAVNVNVIKSGGEAVWKAILLEQDYGLENRLCDKTDLNDSWNITTISEVLATFISSFMNIKISEHLRNHDIDDVNTYDESQEEEEDNSCSWVNSNYALFDSWW